MTETKKKIPTCAWCGQEKTALPEKTEKRGLPVYVCTRVVGKNKCSCDGDVFARVTKKT